MYMLPKAFSVPN